MPRQSALLLTADQMQQVDATAVAQGIDSFELMAAAGRAISDVTVELVETLNDERDMGASNSVTNSKKVDRLPRVVIVAGPGKNGGDGAIAATELNTLGYEVSVWRFATQRMSDRQALAEINDTVDMLASQEGKPAASDRLALTDTDRAFAQWKGVLHESLLNGPGLDQAFLKDIEQADIVIDALFGAGLSRALKGTLETLVDCINKSSAKVISIDVPSGLDGNTHRVVGPCIRADVTVTFFRYKPTHFLHPGAALCGRKRLIQIGLSNAQLDPDWSECLLNEPAWFLQKLPLPSTLGHKFDRGHVLVRSGPVANTGAARLSAQTALECGAGLVTLSCNQATLPVNAAHLTAVMLEHCESPSDWKTLLERDRRINTVVVGPGNGANTNTRMAVEDALRAGKHCIFDADALSCWSSDADRRHLFRLLADATNTAVLTPHGGEFARLFPVLHSQVNESKLHIALAAAKLSSAVVVLKGADTVIACPDARSAINASAPPWLATAGAGDVLAGVIASLIAQGMPSFEAACAGVWLHGEAAKQLGYPMTAEKLAMRLPLVLHDLCSAQLQRHLERFEDI